MDKEQAAEQGRLEDQLRQSQKMEAVGQLTGGVAHDPNNLLAVIRSSTDLLKRQNLPEERRARYVAAISDTVDRAAKLTGQLLAFARRQALKPEVFDACDSVRALSDTMGTLTGSRIRIATDLENPPNHVDVDPSQFDTASTNLAVNARDAMDGQGRIDIKVKPVGAIPAVRSHPTRQGPFVTISLSDTGTGIAAGNVERIFEPFFTTKGVGKGTGLGLSQVFGFVKQSGGDITVESTVGEGTTFTLYLPHVPAPEQASVPEEPEALVDDHGRLPIRRSPGSRARNVHTCQGLRPRWAKQALAMTRPPVSPSDYSTPSAPGICNFRGSMAGLCAPLPTLRRRPHGRPRTARGRCGSLLLHRDGLSPSVPCRSSGALRACE